MFSVGKTVSMRNALEAKYCAWDAVAGLYWRQSIGNPPTLEMLDNFLSDVKIGDRVAVIGASTYNLISEVAVRGASLSVLDFSQRMLDELRADLPDAEIDFHRIDISSGSPSAFARRYDFVLSDRLINRIDRHDIPHALSFLVEMLDTDGMLKCSVRLGLYEADLRVIAQVGQSDTLNSFLDGATNEIDYSRLPPDILEHALGSRELAMLYAARGREKRFTEDELMLYLQEAGVRLSDYQIGLVPFGTRKNDRFLQIRRSAFGNQLSNPTES